MSYIYCVSDDYLTDISYQISDSISPGTAVQISKKRYLSSGQKHFPRTKIKPIHSEEIDKKVKVLDEKSIEIIQRMCEYYYSSIRKILPLWLPYPVEMIDIQMKKHKKIDIPQNLIVIPDIWTGFSMKLHQQHDIIHSASTKKQRLTARKNMKYGLQTTVVTTGSQVFLEFAHLDKIILVDGRQRYYKSQQDPRYHISDVVNKIVDTYQANRREHHSYQDLTL